MGVLFLKRKGIKANIEKTNIQNHEQRLKKIRGRNFSPLIVHNENNQTLGLQHYISNRQIFQHSPQIA
jgi:hypothetical protein